MRLTLAVACLVVGSASGQSFEAATVRIAAPQTGGGHRSISGDRLTFSNTTLLNAFAQAYGLVSRDQVAGPDWILTGTERYDIVA